MKHYELLHANREEFCVAITNCIHDVLTRLGGQPVAIDTSFDLAPNPIPDVQILAATSDNVFKSILLGNVSLDDMGSATRNCLHRHSLTYKTGCRVHYVDDRPEHLDFNLPILRSRRDHDDFLHVWCVLGNFAEYEALGSSMMFFNAPVGFQNPYRMGRQT